MIGLQVLMTSPQVLTPAEGDTFGFHSPGRSHGCMGDSYVVSERKSCFLPNPSRRAGCFSIQRVSVQTLCILPHHVKIQMKTNFPVEKNIFLG